jgi:hypothetical protein
MTRKFIVATVMGLFLASPVSAQTSQTWELVYEHDGYGVGTFGDINDLISATRTGADVKVVTHSPASGDWSATIERANVDLAGSVVTGLVDEVSPNSTDPNDPTLYQRLCSHSTTGETRFRYLNASNVNVVVHYSLSWYVRK